MSNGGSCKVFCEGAAFESKAPSRKPAMSHIIVIFPSDEDNAIDRISRGLSKIVAKVRTTCMTLFMFIPRGLTIAPWNPSARIL